METILNNSAGVVGKYNNIPTAISSSASVVTIVDGLSVTKTADKNVWADGVLTYTIVVSNQTDKVYGVPIITDILDNNLLKFIDGSVIIDGIKATTSQYIFREDTNKLTVNLEDIQPTSISTVIFQVARKS